MSYSIDLRKRVVEFVQSGGSKAEASRRFSVSLWCVNDWCRRPNLAPNTSPGRPRKFDWEVLRRGMQAHPDKLLREWADELGVWTNSIWYASQKMGHTYKKKI